MENILGRPGAPESDRSNHQTKRATVGAVLLALLKDPARLLLARWNWKSAVLSSGLRATIFFLVNLKAGRHAAIGAMQAELALRLLTSGFYGALTEAFSAAEPSWQATAVALVGLPFLNHSLEFLLHWYRHTPVLGPSIAASVLFTALSTAFNLYAMRRGVLTVGGGSKSLQDDLVQIPALLVAFAFAGPRAILQILASAVRAR
jgi:hypothetical protein